MAPSFLQKFVKSSTSSANPNNQTTTPRERVSSDVYSSLRSPGSTQPSSAASSPGGRARAATTSNGSSSSLVSPTTPTQASVILKSSTAKSPSRRSSTNNSTSTGESQSQSRIPSIITTLSGRSRSKAKEKEKEKEKSDKDKSDKDKKKSVDKNKEEPTRDSLAVQNQNLLLNGGGGDRTSWSSAYSSQPNFTIVPPSPLVRTGELYSSDSENDNDNDDAAYGASTTNNNNNNNSHSTANAEPNPAEDTAATPTLPSFSLRQAQPDQGASKNSSHAAGSVITPSTKSATATSSSSTSSSPLATPPISTSSNTTNTTTATTTTRSDKDNEHENDMSTLAPGAYQVRKKTSNKSIRKGGTPPEINIAAAAAANLGGAGVNNNNGNVTNGHGGNGNGGHMRAATAPADAHGEGAVLNGEVTMRPIVESPTDLKFPTSSSVGSGGNANAGSSSITASTSNSTTSSFNPSTTTSTSNPSSSNANLSAPSTATLQRENTTSSILSPDPSSSKSKRPWKRSTTRKPTGLASAIAASGLAMANASLSAAHSAQMPQVPVPPPALSAGSSKDRDKERDRDPYMSRSPAQSAVSTGGGKGGRHGKSRSGEVSPRSSKSRKSSVGSPGQPGTGRSRRASSAKSADGTTEFGALRAGGGDADAASSHLSRRPSYYTHLDGSSSDSDSSGSGSLDSSDLDIGEEDIPVTGFAVASNKRNADFHELFPGVPEGDYLIEDYGCALQREILIQGRIYISENHICFHANIFGWITDLSIPIYEITSLEKKMTAFVIPNAIQIMTRQAKYTFASFLSRDTTFDVIFNIWRLARPEDNVSYMSSGRGSVEGGVGGASGANSVNGAKGGGGAAANGASAAVAPAVAAVAPTGAPQRKATQCACGRENKHYSETAMDVTIPGTPEKINSLMFTSGFIKDFMVGNQKLLDIQMSDWSPVVPGSKLLTRNFSYIKPLNGSLGPKQTKCELKDEMVYCDFDQYVSTVTTTRTPDVPSGGVFSVKTRTCVTWAGPISTRVLVTTQVEWTGRSFIKGIIERSAIDGQKVYHAELEKCMRAYIQEHKSEFLPEGIDASIALVPAPGAPPTSEATADPFSAPADDAAAVSGEKHAPTQEELKQRERERNARGLQWAWDTFDGAWQVGGRSAKGALELLHDAWDQSTGTTILWFVIVVLVASNIWTLVRMGAGRAQAKRKIEARRVEDREKWVQSIVTALWEELNDKAAAAGKPGQVVLPQHGYGQAVVQQPSAVYVEPSSPSVTILPHPHDDDLEARRVRKAHLELEVQQLYQSLEVLEQRVKTIKETLANDLVINTLD